jgi:hypothetical protein
MTSQNIRTFTCKAFFSRFVDDKKVYKDWGCGDDGHGISWCPNADFCVSCNGDHNVNECEFRVRKNFKTFSQQSIISEYSYKNSEEYFPSLSDTKNKNKDEDTEAMTRTIKKQKKREEEIEANTQYSLRIWEEMQYTDERRMIWDEMQMEEDIKNQKEFEKHFEEAKEEELEWMEELMFDYEMELFFGIDINLPEFIETAIYVEDKAIKESQSLALQVETTVTEIETRLLEDLLKRIPEMRTDVERLKLKIQRQINGNCLDRDAKIAKYSKTLEKVNTELNIAVNC